MFHQARLKLTAWYLLIITIVSVFFSLLIYQLISAEIDRFANSQRNRIEHRLQLTDQAPPPSPIVLIDDDLINESHRRLLLNLIIINGIIVIVSGTLSYFLAGRTLSPIQKMLDEQRRFVSDASHELKTPLAALKSLFEVSLRDKNITLSESKKTIKEGIIQTDKLNRLSNSLLELSHFEIKNVQKNFQPISLKKVIQESISQTKSKAASKKIKIINHVTSIKILGDQNKLIELFIIFLDNAIKYSPKNSQIKINSEIKNKYILLNISDRGIGISPKDIPHIFDRFYQADNARTKFKDSGYGLGLSIAKKIVEFHNGKVEVKSKLSSGTTFSIYLPVFS